MHVDYIRTQYRHFTVTGYDKYIVTLCPPLPCTHHGDGFTVLNPHVLHFTPPFPQTLDYTELFTVSIVWLFSRSSYTWNHTVYSLFRWISFQT